MRDPLLVGVFGSSYWSYTAAVHVEHLGEIITLRRTAPDRLPAGVHQQMKTFFALVMSSIGDAIPENPPASLASYEIATALVRATRPALNERAQIDERLRQYSELAASLASDRELTDDEVNLTMELREFFKHLVIAGDVEDYEQAYGWCT